MKAMIVDDDNISLMTLKTLLKAHKIYPKLSRTGLEAIRSYLQYDHDIIFIDIGLPDITGVEIAKLIRHYEKNKLLTRTYIVGVSAHCALQNKEKSLFDVFFNKPVASVQLSKVVNLLNKKEDYTTTEW